MIIMNKAEQMKNVKNGNGIQHLLDEGYRILGNPINTFDTDYRLIAHVDVQADDRFWKELTTTGTFDMEAQLFFMDECFTDDVANAEKLAVMKSDKIKYDRILGHIYNGNGIKVANVLMIEYSKAFDPDMIAAFEVLVDLLTMEIRDDESYIKLGEVYHNTWIKKLIDYDIEEKGLYSPHVQILYNGFEANLFVAVVDTSRSKVHGGAQKHRLVDFLRQKRADWKYAVYGDCIVIVMSTAHKTFNTKRELVDLEEYFERENMFVGVSSCFDNLFELRQYYTEAVQALNAMKPNDNRHIFISENCME